MKRVPLSVARDRLSALIGEVAHGGSRIVLESHGRPKAALVSIEDLQRLETAGVAGADAEMTRWLEQTERVLVAPRRADATLAALDEVREGQVADDPGLYRRQRRSQAGRRRKR